MPPFRAAFFFYTMKTAGPDGPAVFCTYRIRLQKIIPGHGGGVEGAVILGEEVSHVLDLFPQDIVAAIHQGADSIGVVPEEGPGLGPVLGPGAHSVGGDIVGDTRPFVHGFPVVTHGGPASLDGGGTHDHVAHFVTVILGIANAGVEDLIHLHRVVGIVIHVDAVGGKTREGVGTEDDLGGVAALFGLHLPQEAVGIEVIGGLQLLELGQHHLEIGGVDGKVVEAGVGEETVGLLREFGKVEDGDADLLLQSTAVVIGYITGIVDAAVSGHIGAGGQQGEGVCGRLRLTGCLAAGILARSQAGLRVEETAENGAGLGTGHGALWVEVAAGIDAAHDAKGVGPEDAGLHVAATDAGGVIVADQSGHRGVHCVGVAGGGEDITGEIDVADHIGELHAGEGLFPAGLIEAQSVDITEEKGLQDHVVAPVAGVLFCHVGAAL